MAGAEVDTDLLSGILAIQLGLIEQADLLDAFQLWSRDKTRRLAQILVDRGALGPEARTMLEGLVGRHLEKHGGDAGRSLAAVAAALALVTGLRHPGGPDVEATLDRTPCLIDERPPIRDAAETALGAEGESDATTDWTSGLWRSGLGQSSSDGGRFRPLRPHARGGIGMVSVALDSELRREVALKEILAEQADNVASRARFLLEAEVTGQLEHPGVVPVYALGTSGQGRPFYAMRFIRGESLKEAIVGFHKSKAPRGERALALRQLLSRFVGVCDTMAYAHSRGVLHRDLKPSNIMLGPYGETLVVDWGLAKLVGRDDPSLEPSAEATLRPASASGSSETEAGSIVGTPTYMSPEQAEGRLESLGPLSDVYSLGATLYCLLTGRPPFKDEIIAVLRQVRQGDFPPPRQVEPQVPRALEAVVLKAMALHPQDRYDSARELARDIERWLADEPVRAYREPPADRMVRWARNHKPAVAALSVLIVITGSDDTTGRLWDVATGQPIGEPLKHQGSVRTASFRHDGKIVATGSWDKAVRFWDPATGQRAAPPLRLQSLISWVAYSPDDKFLLVGFTDQTARIWDPATGKPISPPFVHKGPVYSAAFRSDGRAALTGSADGTARIWTVPLPAEGKVERIKCWVEVLTRMELSPEGVVRVLSAEEWEARNQRLRDLGGPPTT